MSYGFRMYGVRLTPYRKMSPELQFDGTSFGPDGALGALTQAVATAMASGGDDDENASSFFRITAAGVAGWGITIDAESGAYGRERPVYDVKALKDRPRIRSTQAVMDGFKFILVIPSFGNVGLLISLVSGRSHGTNGLQRSLNAALRPLNLALRLEKELADEVAWMNFLDQSDVDLQSVELVQHHRSSDRTSFGNNASVVTATLTLKLAEKAKGKLLKKLSGAVRKGEPLKIAGAVGLSGAASDDDFDEQKVVYVQDGRRRTISVTQSWPAFVYDLDQEQNPSWVQFLNGCVTESAHLLDKMGVDTANDWWPTVDRLETL